MATVINVADKEQLEQILQEAANVANGPAIVVIDFYATWCHPCSEIAPIFKKLSTRYTKMKFLKIDVDKLEDAAQQYNVRSLSTFVFLRGTLPIDRITGASAQKLRDKVQELAIAAPDSQEGGSQKSSQSSKQVGIFHLFFFLSC
ncbi:unnamed protein product [Trichobilharzia szidati]|nr:unnamed protein product [Trichobilharzia szidati]